jgi:hypothetical protein
MTEETPNKPTKGTWDKLGQKDENKISFDELNIPYNVTFLEDGPQEIESTKSEGEVYYRFKVDFNGNKEAYFDSSAWTLLGALKELAPLKGKQVTIIKKLVKGKQSFEVQQKVA